MEFRHLKYFMAVAEELHFGKAAEKLHMAQPPLSRQIKNLEEELNVKLFERSKKMVRLTTCGTYLKEEAAKIFQHMDIMKNHIRLLREGIEGRIRIGYVGSAMHSVLPRVLTEIRRWMPGVHTSLYELRNLDQIVGLKYGSIDLGFIRTPINVEDLTIDPVFSETLSVILPLSHPLAGSRGIALRDLAEEPFISFCRECAPGLFDCLISLCSRE